MLSVLDEIARGKQSGAGPFGSDSEKFQNIQ